MPLKKELVRCFKGGNFIVAFDARGSWGLPKEARTEAAIRLGLIRTLLTRHHCNGRGSGQRRLSDANTYRQLGLSPAGRFVTRLAWLPRFSAQEAVLSKALSGQG